MNNKMVLKIIVTIIIVIVIVALGLTYRTASINKQQPKTYLVTGLPKGQIAGLQKELEYISIEQKYIDKGDAYLKEGKTQDAIEQFNIVLKRGKKTPALDFARDGLVNAYEKARDYKTAADSLERIMSKYVLPKGDKWRVAEDERLLYLRYASNGDYDLAVEHAQKALGADAQLPNRPKEGREDYIQRLDDLKASKDYILSLKKENKIGK